MIYLVLIALWFILDFTIKNRIEIAPTGCLPKEMAGGHVKLTRLHNKGLAGGRFREKPQIATFISGICLLIVSLVFLPFLLKKGSRMTKLALSMILGGAFGNFFDRLGRGYVVDYLSFPKAKLKLIRKYIYNLADLLIFFGSVLLFLGELFGKD